MALCVVVLWVMLSGYSLPEMYNGIRSISDFIRHIRVPPDLDHLFINCLSDGLNRNWDPP